MMGRGNRSEVNVARASLDELLLDYEDFLRQRRLPLWDKNSAQARMVRGLGKPSNAGQRDQTKRKSATGQVDVFGPYSAWLSHQDPAIVANAVVCLIHQANYLLDLQIAALERAFVRDGGYSERLAAARLAEREKTRHEQVPAADVHRRSLECPSCGKPMVLRTARKGKSPGAQFWGCAGYPACKGTRPAADPNDRSDQSDPTDPTDQCDRMRAQP